MSYETLDFAVAAGVATVTLNRPENMNAMSPQLGAELHEAALAIDADPKIRAVVLTGAGKVFCAGGDLGEFAQAGEGISWGGYFYNLLWVTFGNILGGAVVLAGAYHVASREN